MTEYYPQHLDHKSDEFIKIKNEMLEILKSENKDVTLSVDANDSTRLNVTFTLDFNDQYYYLQADGILVSWVCEKGDRSYPLYSLTNLRISRHGMRTESSISALLAFIFGNESGIKDKFNEYMRVAVHEFRTDNTKTLGQNLVSLKNGQAYAW